MILNGSSLRKSNRYASPKLGLKSEIGSGASRSLERKQRKEVCHNCVVLLGGWCGRRFLVGLA